MRTPRIDDRDRHALNLGKRIQQINVNADLRSLQSELGKSCARHVLMIVIGTHSASANAFNKST